LNLVRLGAAILAATALSSVAVAEDLTHYEEPGLSPGRKYEKQHFAERIDPCAANHLMRARAIS
jgi:hypothetical protein